MFIDSHAHIFFEDYSGDFEAMLQRAVDSGVEAIICPGTDLGTSQKAVALAALHPMIHPCVGFHPHDAAKCGTDGLRGIEELSGERGIVAIGEIGLDYHYDFSPREVQQEVFRAQIEIAVRRNLPVVVHCREADEDCMRIVAELAHSHPQWRADADVVSRGVFHCFAGSVEMARELIALNFVISFPGPLTFPDRPGKPNTMAVVASEISLRHILIETDSPYLTPVPHRGKRNEPAYVVHVADTLARIKNTSREDVGRITNENIRRVFPIQ